MKTFKEDDQVAVLRGNKGERLTWGSWRKKDQEWHLLDVQLESGWYVAVVSVEFSLDKLKEFHQQLQDYENLRVAEFYPEYGDFFSLSLAAKVTGNSLVKGDCAAKSPSMNNGQVMYEFEAEFSSVVTFTSQIGSLLNR